MDGVVCYNNERSNGGFRVSENTPDLVKLNSMRLFAGTGNPGLSNAISQLIGCELGALKIQRFADGET